MSLMGARCKRLGSVVVAVLLLLFAWSSVADPRFPEPPIAAISPNPPMTPQAPSLDPPREEHPAGPEARLEQSVFLMSAAVPSVEWTYHRTADGRHPNGDEQQLMWLMNRARQNPAAEGVWLATAEEFASARDYFQVDTQRLRDEFASYAPKPPAAFDARLYEAARIHSEDLIARNAQDHNHQFQRITDAGFRYWRVGGNVFAYATDAVNAHGAWNIDWGYGSGGMQDGRGHRLAIMAVDGDYTNVGIAAVPEFNPNTRVGPLVVTGNYGEAQENGVDHFNRFIVGTVWRDQNGNGRYDPGEGLSNILVTPDQGIYFAITAAGGGYAIPVTAPGAYQITFSGDGLRATRSIQVAADSVLLDLQTDPALPDATTNLITHYYQAILGRAPEASGLAFWEGEIARVQALGIDVPEAFRVMAGQFFTSAEYLARATGDAGYVADLYATFFAREPDGGGLSYWTGQLAAGLPRSVVLFHFLFSEEFAATMRDLFGEAAGRAEIAAVVDFYRGFLNRLPDEAGFAYWLQRFRSAQCQGAEAVTGEVERISTQFLASAEYAGRRRDHRDFVADLYYAFLRRGGEAAGFQYWVDRLADGSLTRDGARRAFVQTPEFQNRGARIIAAGCVN